MSQFGMRDPNDNVLKERIEFRRPVPAPDA